ncbi:hypothetical protein D3C73_1313310 [compost metagenome]
MVKRLSDGAAKLIEWLGVDKPNHFLSAAKADVKTLYLEFLLHCLFCVTQFNREDIVERILISRRYHRVENDVPFLSLAAVEGHNLQPQQTFEVCPAGVIKQLLRQ